MAAPNLEDPVERAAYRRELHGVARGVRRAGLWCMAAGLMLIAAYRSNLAPVPLWLAVSVVGFGAMLMITGLAARTRYHSLRMRD